MRRLSGPISQVSDADFEDETDRDGTIHKGIETLEALQQGVSREAVSFHLRASCNQPSTMTEFVEFVMGLG